MTKTDSARIDVFVIRAFGLVSSFDIRISSFRPRISVGEGVAFPREADSFPYKA
jgi:hypothetical protein